MILPLTLIRRLDCVLEPTKDRVLAQYAKFKDGIEHIEPVLRRSSGEQF